MCSHTSALIDYCTSTFTLHRNAGPELLKARAENARLRAEMREIASKVSRATSWKIQTPADPRKALHRATQIGDIETIAKHLADGVDVDAAGSGGSTALHMYVWPNACKQQKINVVALF